jgi:hypothetical protein
MIKKIIMTVLYLIFSGTLLYGMNCHNKTQENKQPKKTIHTENELREYITGERRKFPLNKDNVRKSVPTVTIEEGNNQQK